MKNFLELRFDLRACREELNALQTLLTEREVLNERRDVLPFFRARPNLSAFIGSYIPYISQFDRLAYEYELFGDFACDLVVGDSASATYCFIEFEDATARSIFQPSGRHTLDWSARFEHGFSQLIDWFWKLDDMRGSQEFEHRFGQREIRYYGMLILGRTGGLSTRERQRLLWRLDKVLIDSKQIICLTFDELLSDLNSRLQVYERMRLVG